MAEYGSSGIWLVKQCGVFRHSMIEHSGLNLPKSLSAKFDRWIEKYEENLLPDFSFDTDQFNAEGRRLAKELFDFMKGKAEIEFVPENYDGGLSASELLSEGSESRVKGQ